jgi:hypothetical protein
MRLLERHGFLPESRFGLPLSALITLVSQLPRLRTLDIQRNPVSPSGGPAPSDLIGSLRRAFPGLVLLNGEILALAQLVRPLPSSPAVSRSATAHTNETRMLAPRAKGIILQVLVQLLSLLMSDSVASSEASTDFQESNQLSPFDVQAFIARETRRLEGARCPLPAIFPCPSNDAVPPARSPGPMRALGPRLRSVSTAPQRLQPRADRLSEPAHRCWSSYCKAKSIRRPNPNYKNGPQAAAARRFAARPPPYQDGRHPGRPLRRRRWTCDRWGTWR